MCERDRPCLCAKSLILRHQAALDTLCSQSFASPNPKETSLHALRTAYLTVLIMIPAIIVILNGESLLLLLRQDPEVAFLAGRYLKGEHQRYPLVQIMTDIAAGSPRLWHSRVRRFRDHASLAAMPGSHDRPYDLSTYRLANQHIPELAPRMGAGKVPSRIHRSTHLHCNLVQYDVPLFCDILRLLRPSDSLGWFFEGNVQRLETEHRFGSCWVRIRSKRMVGVGSYWNRFCLPWNR